MCNLNARATEAVGRYLGHRGYTVLETGWTCPAGTADIVAEDGDTIVFADLASRSSAERGFPSESRSKKERTRRESIAIAWLAEHEDVVDRPIRFDNLALAVEDVPQTLAVDGRATRELGDADAARAPRFLHTYDDQLRVIHPLIRLPSGSLLFGYSFESL